MLLVCSDLDDHTTGPGIRGCPGLFGTFGCGVRHGRSKTFDSVLVARFVELVVCTGCVKLQPKLLKLALRILAMGDINDQLLVQIGSYNTNLQAGKGLPQNLVDWLSPTFQVSSFLSKAQRAPDIVAIGFQELLPLHLGRGFPISRVCNKRD